MSLLISALSVGFLGSLHCIGMCGGFAGALAMNKKKFMTGLLAYQTGRILTYSLAGFVAGISGFGLGIIGGSWVQKAISVIAGLAMVLMGLNLMGLIKDPLRNLTSAIAGKLKFGNKIRDILEKDSLSGWFGMGLVNGLLPCGLVYAALFMALSAENTLLSLLVMTFFGLGTLPAMMFAPSILGLMTPRFRLNAVRLSGILLLIFGLFTIFRGTFMKMHIHNHNIIEHTKITDQTCDSPFPQGEQETRP